MRRAFVLLLLLAASCHRDLTLQDCSQTPDVPRCTDAGRHDSDVSESGADSQVDGGSARCAGRGWVCDGNILIRCDGAAESAVATCGTSTDCDASLGRCKSCTPGEAACDGARLLKCDDYGAKQVVSATCASGALCNATAAACDAPACAVGDARCDATAKSVERCRGDRAAFELDAKCDVGCAGGKCLLITKIAANGGFSTCARTSDGLLRCWGANSFGQLGSGSTFPSSRPQLVSGLAAVVDVDISFHACAALATGTVSCWGNNADGQLGDGTKLNRLSPVPVLGPTAIIQAATGSNFTCVRSSSDVVYCWGANEAGQLGVGTISPTTTWSSTPTIANARSVRAGASHACAILNDDSLWCWGANSDGQLGDGTRIGRLKPTKIGIGSVADVAPGSNTHAPRPKMVACGAGVQTAQGSWEMARWWIA